MLMRCCSIHTYHAALWKGAIHQVHHAFDTFVDRHTRRCMQVQLSGLAPATRYYYRVGDAQAGWSDTYSFMTEPLLNDPNPQIIGVFGDMGTAIPAGFEVCKQMEMGTACHQCSFT